MSFVALATCRKLPEPDVDEPYLLAALSAAKIPARMLAWDDPLVDWDAPRLVVIRSTWNYYLHLDAFLAWVLARGDRLVNAAGLIVWNHHKRYLRDLEAAGIPVVPTLWVDRGSTLGDGLRLRGWTDIVVKPAVSAGSYRTSRLQGPPFDEAVLAATFAAGDAMVQPFVASVEGHGERSLIAIDGEITHAIRKCPRFHGQAEQVSSGRVPIADDEREIASRALAHVSRLAPASGDRPGSPLYARIDLVRDAAGQPMLSELELIEPSLFLTQNPAAIDRLVAGIARRLRAV
jgi:glutathione synthase/RimK-type ligase-like ATP-grasp enzyme